MKYLIRKLYQWQLPKLISRKCEATIPRSGEAGEQVNCYVVAIDDKSEPYFLVSEINDDKMKGLKWNGRRYNDDHILNINDVINDDLIITHYYGLNVVQYRGIYDFIRNNYTALPYIKIHIHRIIEKSNQYFFNKKKLVTQKRIDLLKFMINDQLERDHDGIGLIDLMTKLYTIKWVLHPEGEDQQKKVEFYLDSLIASGDIKDVNHQYVVNGSAIASIEKFEEEERRHTENVKMQKKTFWLTIIITCFALVQANVIKLPTILDFSKTTLNTTE